MSNTDHGDDDLRRLLADATSDITPHGTLDDIRDKTKKVDPMAQRWFLPSLAAAAAMALVIGGAFWITRDDGQGGSNVAAPPTPVDAKVYFVGDAAQGERLFSETSTVDEIGPDDDRSPDPEQVARLSISGKPKDPDYRSLWPAGVEVRDVGFSGDAITVALEAPVARPQGMTEAQARLAVNAVARTLLGVFPDSRQVTFGSEVLGLGADEIFDGGSDDEVLALVSIGNLAEGQVVPTGDLVVEGTASAFEANVAWELMLGGDTVIQSGFATAAECCTLSPYTFTVQDLEPGEAYTLVVHDVDESGEGLPENRDTKNFVVR